MDAGDRERHNLEGLRGVEVVATAELGRIDITTAQLRTLRVGDVLSTGRDFGSGGARSMFESTMSPSARAKSAL